MSGRGDPDSASFQSAARSGVFPKVRVKRNVHYEAGTFHPHRKKWIAGDPGVKTFFTLVNCVGDVFTIGEDLSWRMRQIHVRLARLQSERARWENVVGIGVSQVVALDKAMRKLRDELARLVHALHESASEFLSHFDQVLLPRLGVKELLASGRTGKQTKTLLATLSHLRFFDKLRFKLGKRGHQLVEVSEAYSSQVCCCCGTRSPPGRSRRFACANPRCRARLGRDENAAWNIALFAMARIERLLLVRGPVLPKSDVAMDNTGEDGGAPGDDSGGAHHTHKLIPGRSHRRGGVELAVLR